MRLARWIVLVLLSVPRLAFAAPETVMLEELTWIELRDRVQSGKTTILVPIGWTEQNGPHMVLGKHNVRAKALAGPPSQHMRFPGTITTPATRAPSSARRASS